MISLTGENIVLIGALLLFVAVVAGKLAYRFGAPALLLFLGVGMLFGLDFISYRSTDITQFIGMISLCVILFTGGMDTKVSEIKSFFTAAFSAYPSSPGRINSSAASPNRILVY